MTNTVKTDELIKLMSKKPVKFEEVKPLLEAGADPLSVIISSASTTENHPKNWAEAVSSKDEKKMTSCKSLLDIAGEEKWNPEAYQYLFKKYEYIIEQDEIASTSRFPDPDVFFTNGLIAHLKSVGENESHLTMVTAPESKGAKVYMGVTAAALCKLGADLLSIKENSDFTLNDFYTKPKWSVRGFILTIHAYVKEYPKRGQNLMTELLSALEEDEDADLSRPAFIEGFLRLNFKPTFGDSSPNKYSFNFDKVAVDKHFRILLALKKANITKNDFILLHRQYKEMEKTKEITKIDPLVMHMLEQYSEGIDNHTINMDMVNNYSEEASYIMLMQSLHVIENIRCKIGSTTHIEAIKAIKQLPRDLQLSIIDECLREGTDLNTYFTSDIKPTTPFFSLFLSILKEKPIKALLEMKESLTKKQEGKSEQDDGTRKLQK